MIFNGLLALTLRALLNGENRRLDEQYGAVGRRDANGLVVGEDPRSREKLEMGEPVGEENDGPRFRYVLWCWEHGTPCDLWAMGIQMYSVCMYHVLNRISTHQIREAESSFCQFLGHLGWFRHQVAELSMQVFHTVLRSVGYSLLCYKHSMGRVFFHRISWFSSWDWWDLTSFIWPSS